ncbi:MAG: hypothetical protein AAF543_20205 [Pseudomonadota bacterium]
MVTLAAIDGGTYFHHQSLYEAPFGHYFDERIYVQDVSATDLSACKALLLPCRLNADLIAVFKDQLVDYMRAGGTLVAMGETFPDRWLPGIAFTACETNFWWWVEGLPGPDIQIVDTDHPLMAGMTADHAIWHLHGHFRTSPAQRPLIDEVGGTLLFEDTKTYAPGRLIATSLDPMYHHGSHFMPATTRFLDVFLPALRAYVSKT